ncbi:MAG: hypothetical protein IPL53_14120 [Ignavibacteria bacterium]|nr:hypothetical protein [Ignavibacteria bacterium]
MSQSVVETISQDSKGFIWLGTQQGLNRYDGYNLRTYLNDPLDPSSLKYNSVQDLYTDKSGKLWIASYADTISTYNNRQDNFSCFNIRDKLKSDHPALQITSIAEDSKGNLWIGTYEGLIKYETASGIVKHFNENVKEANSLPCERILCLYIDEDDLIRIGTREKGISIFDEKKMVFENYKITDLKDAGEIQNRVYSIYKDSRNNLLISTGKGLKTFDLKSKKITDFEELTEGSELLRESMIQCITEDKNENLWIGTRNNGILFYDRRHGNFQNFRFSKTDNASVSNDRILKLFNDSSNVTWVGTFAGGVCRADCEQKKFYHVKEVLDEKSKVFSDKITAFSEDVFHNLWIGTHGDGLFRISNKEGNTENFRDNKKNENSLKGISVFSILDKVSDLWIGVSSEGINRYCYKNDTFQNFKLPDSKYNEVSCIINFPDKESRYLLVGTTGSGIFVFDTAENKFTPFMPESSQSGISDSVKCMLIDSNNFLWAGTINQGLKKINLKNNDVKIYRADSPDNKSISDNYITVIAEDSRKNLWIGTRNGGLNKYNKTEDSFHNYSIKSGLPNNDINGIVEAEPGILWLSTNKGISKFDTMAETFRNFDSDDGLQSNEFNEYAYYKASNGTLYFGGVNGFNYFKPNEIKDNPYVPEIVITDFQIFNHPVKNSLTNSFLKLNITETKEIVLSYRESVFSFEFAALIYNNPLKNQYAYMMEGFDKEWIYSGTRRFATYTNLEPGDYVFRVRGSNNDGIWNEEGASVKIKITPPFWKTWWFKSLGALSVAGATGYTYRQKLAKIEQEKKAQEEFSKSLIDREESERKRISKELHDSIAHDILITKNKAELGMKRIADPEMKKILNEISELSSQTLNDVRSISNHLHPQILEKLGLTKAIKSVVKHVAGSTGISFTEAVENIDDIQPVELRINIFRIIQECTNNIIKHSGATEASLNILKDNRTLTITVWDNGKGISKNRIDGLGLTGIEERVKLYKGELVIESAKTKGTIIVISIPYKNSI